MKYILPKPDSSSTDEFISLIKNAPKNTTSLDFQNNNLSVRSSSELTRIFGAISELEFVNELDLSFTGIFDNKTSHDYAQFLAFIPGRITTLHLDNNDLSNKSVYEVTHLFTAIPEGVTTLTLRDTKIFSNKKTAQSVCCVAAIPKNIKHLDLSDTRLIYKSSRDIEKIVAVMPNTLETLRWEFTNFTPTKIVKAMLIVLAEKVRLKVTGSFEKERAFTELFAILQEKENNMARFPIQIEEWKNRHLSTINHQRNKLHAFFAPKHKTESFLMLEKIFAILEISLEVNEPSPPQESFEPSF